MLYLGVNFLVFIPFRTFCASCISRLNIFIRFYKCSATISPNVFFSVPLYLFFLGTLITWILADIWCCSTGFWWIVHLPSFLFPLCPSDWSFLLIYPQVHRFFHLASATELLWWTFHFNYIFQHQNFCFFKNTSVS